MTVLTDYQFNYQDVAIIGDGTNCPLFSVEGLDAPDVRDQDQDRFDSDGQIAGKDMLTKRIVTIELDTAMADAAALETVMATLRAAFHRRTDPLDEQWLAFKLPGQVQKRIYCRPRKRRIPIDLAYARLNPKIVIEFAASDPRIYTDTETNTLWAADGTTQALNNLGNIEMFPVITVDGPTSTAISMFNDTTGLSFVYNTALSGGQTLIVDLMAGTVKLNGVNSSTPVTGASRLWWLQAGNNNVRITTGNAADRGVKWRSAWDGV